ncbi:MAG: hypothetical protein FJX42_04810 [Alphaproteobacteria bacterium]|nr:hypothetical protein [Alphaproteobacteria bacterium]
MTHPLLAELESEGLRLRASGNAVIVTPPRLLTDKRRETIRAHKAELLAALRQDRQPSQDRQLLELAAFSNSAGFRGDVGALEMGLGGLESMALGAGWTRAEVEGGDAQATVGGLGLLRLASGAWRPLSIDRDAATFENTAGQRIAVRRHPRPGRPMLWSITCWREPARPVAA